MVTYDEMKIPTSFTLIIYAVPHTVVLREDREGEQGRKAGPVSTLTHFKAYGVDTL